jgi:uncharacterized membrane protein
MTHWRTRRIPDAYESMRVRRFIAALVILGLIIYVVMVRGA